MRIDIRQLLGVIGGTLSAITVATTIPSAAPPVAAEPSPVALAATAATAADNNTPTAQEKSSGWTLLFDGKTTTGWHGYKQTTAPAGWTVVNGEVTRTGAGGDLVSIDQYADSTRLVIKGAHVEHWLNGVNVVESQLWTPEWKKLVANNKFKQWPAHGMAKSGHIALQDHGDQVAFKNVKIRVLK